MEIDLSIVIPIYNAESTLARTISSVREINNLETEIILVDDGSFDSSLSICTDYSKLDDRIIVCTQKNRGVSAARNIGISKATGKYICFFDADDSIFPRAIESVVSAVRMDNLDMAITDYEEYNVLNNRSLIISPGLPYDKILRKDFILKEIYRRIYYGENIGLSNVWNKIFKTEIIKHENIQFEESRTHGEDWQFVIDYFAHTNSFKVFMDSIYRYYIDGSHTVIKYRKGLIKSIISSTAILEKVRQIGNFDLSPSDYERILIKQFLGVIEFLNLDISTDEAYMLRHNKSIKTLSKKILRLSPKSIQNANCSRNIYLIALSLYFGQLTLSKKLLKRGF